MESKMVPLVDLSEPTYQQLQKLAEPFVDKTPEDVIIKLIHSYAGSSQLAVASASPGTKEYGIGAAPNLGHTKILSAELNGVALKNANWNRLLDEVISQAAKKLKDVKSLKELIVVNCVEGRKEDQGYRYLSTAGVSVQGQDSNGAWKAVAHLAKAVKFSVQVVFVWYDNPKAANPGQTGKLTITQ
jgi:hypothetical protein